MSKKILLVEDDKDFSEAVKIILESEDYEVFHSVGIKDALESTEKQSYDIAIIDYHLPDGDGAKIIKKLREQIRTKYIPFIIMSADSSVQGEAMEAGARWFMPKPIDFGVLLKRLQRVTHE